MLFQLLLLLILMSKNYPFAFSACVSFFSAFLCVEAGGCVCVCISERSLSATLIYQINVAITPYFFLSLPCCLYFSPTQFVSFYLIKLLSLCVLLADY
uniref:Uncharacterized protein n=1 Tax=Octopus bimaculoides TaxID=37653 RepID=A0A0L8G8G9_OCTBM